MFFFRGVFKTRLPIGRLPERDLRRTLISFLRWAGRDTGTMDLKLSATAITDPTVRDLRFLGSKAFMLFLRGVVRRTLEVEAVAA